MPIRFRCAYCNKLLGIAKRKAGTVVRCPGCSGQVVVPTLAEAGLAAAGPTAPTVQGPGAGAMFEGDAIDKMLEGAAGDMPSVIPGNPGQGVQSVRAQAVAPSAGQTSAGPRGPGIYLSPAKATLLTVIIVVALAVAFGVGLLVGLGLGMRQATS
jgi:hypothetical protein